MAGEGSSSHAVRGQPWYTDLRRQAKRLAIGEHQLSKYIPPALLLCDALLCSLIISKVPCKLLAQSSRVSVDLITLCRYGNRLESLYGTSRVVHGWRTGLYQYQRWYRALGLPRRACVHLLGIISYYKQRDKYFDGSTDLWGLISGHIGCGHGLL
jgi:hypothetical protein